MFLNDRTRNSSFSSSRPSTARSFSGTSATSYTDSFAAPPPLPKTAGHGRIMDSPRSMTRSFTPSEEATSTGYIYSLRVAVLLDHLQNPPTPRLPTSPTSPAGLPSPPVSGSSRLGFLNRDPSANTPESPSSPHTIRRKSSFGISLKSNKSDDVKLPKEFLMEFWGALANEDGDAGWRAGVNSFLSMIKKGTKTEAGMNLREIPTLLEVFSSNVPPQGPSSAPAHVHQLHFLEFLYKSLPRLPHFNANARPQSEKDRDQLFRIRAEVQTYMGRQSGSNTLDAPPSPQSYTTSLERSRSRDSRRRGSTPDVGSLGGLIDSVAETWGVSRDILERDVADIRLNPLEKLYLNDLKRSLSALSLSRNPAQKNRQTELNRRLGRLLRDFPELSVPSSPIDARRQASEESYFTPPRKSETFAKLSKLGGKSDLVARCREIWCIGDERERDAEIESLVHKWGDSIGSPDEMVWTVPLVDAIQDLDSASPLSPAMQHLVATLLALLGPAISSVFPLRSAPGPPPSLLPLLSLEPIKTQARVLKTIDELSDELKGGAITEYVRVVGEMASSGSIEGFERAADWIEQELADIKRAWPSSSKSPLNPAAIVLSKQLPLFLAELHALDRPMGSVSGEIFGLYESTGRLLDQWDELCPGQEHGFELDAFFEPHVLAWLKDTESSQTQEWVSRAVGMDSWVPEGVNRHSQSVIDLFDFIRGSAKVILHDLPLGEYKRAIYLIDLSKTVSIAVSQYASTVFALFTADLAPKVSTPTAEIQNQIQSRLGSKAGNWLAKGQQAVKSLQTAKVDAFLIPPTSCVKLTDMGAAQISLDDLVFAMEAEETARIVKPATNAKQRYVFSVTLMRGENLLGKSKAADAFVTITNRMTNERHLKSRTVISAEDPRWEQGFEVTVDTVRQFELACFDRSLVGKHDPIGTASFKLDPRVFSEQSTRDIVLPLNPRGLIHLRVRMEGGEKHDVQYHLSSATRALERAERDMSREIVEKMGEYIKSFLSANNIANLVKEKKKLKQAIDERDLEQALGPLFEYLNANLSTFSVTLTQETRLRLMVAMWRYIVSTLTSILIPPLSDRPVPKPSPYPPSPQEVDIVFKYLQMLKAFFNAKEDHTEHGVPLGQLQQGPYKDLLMVGQYLDLPTPALRERVSGAVKGSIGRSTGLASQMGRMSVDETYGNEQERMAEVLLRIARTRPDLNDFVREQLASLTRARVERQQGLM